MSTQRTVRQIMVPIIGRPNVGKSTLFNRLIGEERALTGPRPGVTRDRISQPLEWNGCRITLVDTAGYDRSDSDREAELPLRQVEEMIEQGELLLFVVDAQEGIHPNDRRIAEQLYPYADRVLVLLNKVDPGVDPESTAAEFYELGFDRVLPVSARHGRFVGELRETITENVPDTALSLSEDAIQLCLVGRPNVGKSTLFNQILGYERVMVSEQPGTTRDLVDVSFDVGSTRFQLVDTVGLRRRNRVGEELEEAGIYQSIRAIDFSDVACLMLDYYERVTKQDQRIAGLINDRYRGCLLLVNKADTPDEDAEEAWVKHVRERLHFLDYAPVLFTSGRRRRGFSRLFDTASDIHEQMNRSIHQEELSNAFLDMKTRISFPTKKSMNVIVQRIRQVDVNPPTFALQAKNPGHLKKADLRHLRRLLRDELDLPNSPVKLQVSEEWEDE